MNSSLRKNAAAIMRNGGYLFLAEKSDKNLDKTFVTILDKELKVNEIAAIVKYALGAATSGKAKIDTEVLDYSAITGKTLTITSATVAHPVKSHVTLYDATTGYAGLDCVGYSSESELDPGIPEEVNTVDENNDNVAAFIDGNEEPMFTHNMLQSGIDNIIFATQRDKEAATENGAAVVSQTRLKDFAGIYVAQRKTGTGTTKYYVIKMPWLRLSGSTPMGFKSDENTVINAKFKILLSETEGYDLKIMEVG